MRVSLARSLLRFSPFIPLEIRSREQPDNRGQGNCHGTHANLFHGFPAVEVPSRKDRNMTTRYLIALMSAAVLVTGCDESVRLEYATRADAEDEPVFARGWLPEIIPPSSSEITMKNDLDLNMSQGGFKFDVADFDAFVKQLTRIHSQDAKNFSAYSFEDWTFWIGDSRDRCRYEMRLTRKTQVEQVTDGDGG